jgi:hydroxymethylbilane synthase
VTPSQVRIATRGSALARWQAGYVAEQLRVDHPDLEVELVVVETSGDRRQDIPIWELGGKGVFVKEVQAAVLDGRADLAVHSAKDLPAVTHEGLVIGCVPTRADPRDVLVGSSLADLAPGAVVATGSARRRAQLANLRPDLTFAGLRGNIDTRLGRAREFGAIVMAAAALHRLDREAEITEVLEPSVMLPQVGQGALAVECRVDDHPTGRLLAPLEHRASRLAVDAERGFLAELGGDCDLPAGAHATLDRSGEELTLVGLVASLDGHVVLRHQDSWSPSSSRATDGAGPAGLGRAVARFLLDDAGGSALLTG